MSVERQLTLCLDLVNTVAWRLTAEPEERLNNYSDVIAWACEVDVLTPTQARALEHEARAHPSRAAESLMRTREIREVIARVLSHHAQGRAPKRADVEALGTMLAMALSHARLIHGRDGYSLAWPATKVSLDRPWWAAIRSAADVLTSPQLAWVKQCADVRGCGWLFLDMTKNHSRRFCSSASCANVAKQARHRRRTTAQAAKR